VFGGEFAGEILRFGNHPTAQQAMGVPNAEKNLIMHIALPILDGHLLMGTDITDSMNTGKLLVGNNIPGMLPGGAVRSGKWKLIEWYEKSILNQGESAFELYDLENDIGETVDLAGIEKDITRRLSGDLARWRKQMNAQMPVPNPNY
jgi:hypothetical protein